MRKSFVESVNHFAPHIFSWNEGEGLFMSHAHDQEEITLITGGNGFYISQGRNIKVTAGDILLIPPKLFHGFVCVEAWEGVSVHFKSDGVPHYCKFLFEQAYQKSERDIVVSKLSGNEMERVRLAVLQLEQESVQDIVDDFSYDIARNALETILLLFHRNRLHTHEVPNTSEHQEQSLLQEVLRDIHRSYNAPLKVSDLAARHFLSESILRRKFTDQLGISPKQYIINLRLNEAKKLLLQTDKPIEFISSEVGFTASSRFHDLFLKHTGMTPMEWRKSY